MKLFQAIITITPLLSTTNAARYLRRQLQSSPSTTSGGTEDDNSITFPAPTHHGKLVDYCLTFKQDCGKPAADRYCAEKNFGEAVGYPKSRTYNESTLTMEGHETCTPSHNTCDTFSSITCSVETQTYYDPKEGEGISMRPLDTCITWEVDCDSGQIAADTFCEDKGYSGAVNFAMIRKEDEPTMTIGDHAVCDPNWHECNTYTFITCIA